MKKEPLFSVIIPTLNEEKFLPLLLESLTKQTFKNFQVIVSDGPSKDKTKKIALSYGKSFSDLQLVTSKKANLPHQRNNGAKHATGKWYVFIDADSVLLPYALERMEQFIKRLKPQLFTVWFRSDSEKINDALVSLFGMIMIEGGLLLKRPHAMGPLSVVRRDAFKLVNGYDESLEFLEDYDFSTRLKKKGVQMHILRETLFILSLRRFRKQGSLVVISTYIRSIIQALFTQAGPKSMKHYIMGGHVYTKKKKMRKPVFTKFEKQLKEFINEVFS